MRALQAQKRSLSERLYTAILRLLPFDFRSEFGSEMEQAFAEQRRDVEKRASVGALLEMWWLTIRDVFRMAPREHLTLLAQDTRFALRMMRKNPGYTLTAVLILGLGVGASTAMFSVVSGVMLKPLPYVRGQELVVLNAQARGAGLDNLPFSPPEVREYREQNHSLRDVVESHSMMFTLFTHNTAQRVHAGVVSASYFDLFGIKPILGRSFESADERPGAAPVVLLSYEFWKEQEGGDPQIVGKVFEMNDRPHTVIGVLPAIPQYPQQNDLYMTTTSCPFRSAASAVNDRNWRMMSVFGRLKPGMTVARCGAETSAIAARLEHQYPQDYPEALGYAMRTAPLREELVRGARPMLLLLLATAGIVLLIAFANVANLIHARMLRRERELTIRTALGAGSGRLLRQLVTESFLLSILAAAVGVALAVLGVHTLSAFVAHLTPRAGEITVDSAVLAFAVGCAVVTAIVFGSVAALSASRGLTSRMREGSAQSTLSASRARLRGTLLVLQVAFSYVLLIGAGLTIRSFIHLQNVNPGFTSEHTLAAAIDLNWSKYQNGAEVRAIADRMLARVRALPGVASAAVSSSFPLDPDALTMGPWQSSFRVFADPHPNPDKLPVVVVRAVSPDYFETLGIPILAGRAFRDSDRPGSLPVAMISKTIARHYWPHRDPLGQKISIDGKNWLTVAGVTGDVKEFGLGKVPPDQVYVPMAVHPNLSAILVRASGDPSQVLSQVRRAILDVDPQTAIVRLQTLDEVRSGSVSLPRIIADIFGMFSSLALIIAVTGLGSMLALTVGQRTREIAIRMALGATVSGVSRAVLGEGLFLVAIGVAAGWAGSVALTRFLSAVLFETSPTDVLTFALITAVLVGTALAAAYLPARRAASIDPQIALRAE